MTRQTYLTAVEQLVLARLAVQPAAKAEHLAVASQIRRGLVAILRFPDAAARRRHYLRSIGVRDHAAD